MTDAHRTASRIGHQEYRLNSYDERPELATVKFFNGGITLAPTPPDDILVREAE